MQPVTDKIKVRGEGEIEILFGDGTTTKLEFTNAMVGAGRAALAKSLANQFGGSYQYWVQSMVFGTGGSVGGTPRYVMPNQGGLYGPVVATKTVLSTINPANTGQATFTSVLLFGDAVGDAINEMGLVMNNGEYFSITTFNDINKTASMQLTVNWRITFMA